MIQKAKRTLSIFLLISIIASCIFSFPLSAHAVDISTPVIGTSLSSQSSPEPSPDESGDPSAVPSSEPSAEPNPDASAEPSVKPSAEPSVEPSPVASAEPSAEPSNKPSAEPKPIPDGLNRAEDGAWYYYNNGQIDTSYTGLVKEFGTWFYIENGMLNWNFTGLVKEFGTWFYVEKGTINWNYTGLVKDFGTWFYVDKGILNWQFTGLVKQFGTWFYVEKSVLNWNYTGLVKDFGAWFYVNKGVLNWQFTGLVKQFGTWFYVERSVLNWNYTGLVKDFGTWFYIDKSVLNWNYSDAVFHNGNWYLIKNGILEQSAIGTAKTTDSVNLRNGAGTGYPVTRILPKNTTLAVFYFANGKYAYVAAPDGTCGYCSQSYLNYTANPISNSTSTDLLLLVNPWNKVPTDYSTGLVTIGDGYRVDARCYDDLKQMMHDCAYSGTGARPYICSAYRTYETQLSLYNNKVNRLVDQGYSRAEAKIVAARSVAIPGTSEHQLGLAVDIIDLSYQILDSGQERTATQRWLIKNSWKYGFILRYPSGKSSVTGIIYEPWHYRYVGKENAKAIYESGLCLEEYLAAQRVPTA